MFSVIVCGGCLAAWITLGFIYFFNSRSQKQELRVTPFTATASWIMFIMILVEFAFDFVQAISLIGGK